IDHPTGTPQRPMSDEDISGKFRALADSVLEPARSQELLAALWRIDEAADVGKLMSLAGGVSEHAAKLRRFHRDADRAAHGHGLCTEPIASSGRVHCRACDSTAEDSDAGDSA